MHTSDFSTFFKETIERYARICYNTNIKSSEVLYENFSETKRP